MVKLDPRLAEAMTYLAIAESKDSKREAYRRAAKLIAAYKRDTNASFVAIAEAIGRIDVHSDSLARRAASAYISALVKWAESGFKTETPWADQEETKRTKRAHARTVLADPNEAAKVIADMSANARATLAKAIQDDPGGRRALQDDTDRRLRHASTSGKLTQQPKYPLLHRIEGDRVAIERAAELMVGHWHDGRHDIGEEEEQLVRDSMAEAVIAVEKIVTGALGVPA